MDPVVWGPSMWASIHAIAIGYPEHPSSVDAQAYRNFFANLHLVLPCQACADHYKEHWKANPINNKDLQSADALFAWTVRLHNAVNSKLGKPALTVEEARAAIASRAAAKNVRLEPDAPRAPMSTSSVLLAIALVGVIVCVAWYGSGGNGNGNTAQPKISKRIGR